MRQATKSTNRRAAGEARPSLGGNGETVPNEGQVGLNLVALDGDGPTRDIHATFQIAEINRPLMSVSRICDQGYRCTFTEKEAIISDREQNPIRRFDRSGSLYVTKMKLKAPGPFGRQAP